MVLHADFAGSQIARAVKPCERNCGWSCFTSQSGVFFFLPRRCSTNYYVESRCFYWVDGHQEQRKKINSVETINFVAESAYTEEPILFFFFITRDSKSNKSFRKYL